MRHRIAVFLGEIAGDFQHTIIDTITKRANGLGYDVAVICSYGSYNDDILYSEGEKACINLPDCSIFSGIIVAEDLFDIHGMGDELFQILKKTANCPVVYLRTAREGFYSILFENKLSIENMVRHFTEYHGFRDICYMSGKKETVDARERLQGYLTVMNQIGVTVTEHMVFHGDYWRDKGKEAVDWFMEGRETYPEAIVCANDYMALSICEELHKRGVRVPEDVCVSGFDFVKEARSYDPVLTTLEVDFEGMSAKAVDIIDNVNKGNKEEPVQKIEAKLRLNRSCGCGEQHRVGEISSLIEDNYKHVANMKNTMLMTMECQDAFEFDEYMAVADKFTYMLTCDRLFFCFKDSEENGYGEVENDSAFTNQMVLRRIFTKGVATKDKLQIKFPRKNLLPDEFWKEDEPNNYLFFSLHFKNIVYGYVVTELPKSGWFDIYMQAYLMNLANAIENSNIHNQMAMLEEIRALYNKDALTGLYNRRGFDKLLRDKFISSRENGENIGIASIDMDNLKSINDNYGHAEGDRAIKTMANALESVMEDGEFCARIGGDEFAAVLVINENDRSRRFKDAFGKAMNKYAANIDEYKVGASVGISETAEEPGAPLVNYIKKADMRMYEEKRTRKGHR